MNNEQGTMNNFVEARFIASKNGYVETPDPGVFNEQ